MLHTFSAVKKLLCITAGLDDNTKTYMREYLVDINIHRIPPFCAALFLLETTNFIVDITTNAHPEFLLQYMAASLSLAVVAVLFFFFTLFRVIRRPCGYRLKKTTCLVFWTLIAAGISFFSLFDIMERGALTNYIVLVTVLAVIPVLSLGEDIVFMAAVAVFQCTALLLYGADVFVIQQCALIPVFGMVVSQFFYRSSFSIRLLNRKLQEANDKLEMVSQTDRLTGLLNRWGFDRQIEAVYRYEVITVLMLDIDWFKNYNDQHGHLAGDDRLVVTADEIRTLFGQEENILSRYGGEEFLLIVPGRRFDEVQEKALLLKHRIAIRQSVSVDGQTFPPASVSIGAACGPACCYRQFLTLINEADRQMYNAKSKGRDAISFESRIYR